MVEIQGQRLTRFTPATTLDEIHQTLSPEPLATKKELETFYCDKINETRGGDKIERLKLGLKRAWASQAYYKACLMGNPGVGKSTELNRLINDLEVKKQFRAIKFNILTDLDIELVEKTKEIDNPPSDENLQALINWYNTTKITQKENRNSEIKGEAGAGVKENSLWHQILALFASIKGEMRFASSREKEVTEHRFKRINDLIQIANNIISECNCNLKEEESRQWLITRKAVVQQLANELQKQGISFTEIRLPLWSSSSQVLNFLLDELEKAGSGVVSLIGFETAFNPQNLDEAMRTLNFNRENFAQFNGRQIWWMSHNFLNQVINFMPDLNSWFTLRLSLTDNLQQPLITRPLA